MLKWEINPQVRKNQGESRLNRGGIEEKSMGNRTKIEGESRENRGESTGNRGGSWWDGTFENIWGESAKEIEGWVEGDREKSREDWGGNRAGYMGTNPHVNVSNKSTGELKSRGIRGKIEGVSTGNLGVSRWDFGEYMRGISERNRRVSREGIERNRGRI